MAGTETNNGGSARWPGARCCSDQSVPISRVDACGVDPAAVVTLTTTASSLIRPRWKEPLLPPREAALVAALLLLRHGLRRCSSASSPWPRSLSTPSSTSSSSTHRAQAAAARGGEHVHAAHTHTHTHTHKLSKVTLSGLINMVEGLWSSSGHERILIFTTNHKDRLDPALLQRCRNPFKTLLPLHTAVASARLQSCIAVDSTCWCSRSQGRRRRWCLWCQARLTVCDIMLRREHLRRGSGSGS